MAVGYVTEVLYRDRPSTDTNIHTLNISVLGSSLQSPAKLQWDQELHLSTKSVDMAVGWAWLFIVFDLFMYESDKYEFHKPVGLSQY